MRADVSNLSMDNPGDVSALAALIDEGALDPRDIVAIIGKTEGNGGVNDFTRGFFTDRLMRLLSRHLGESEESLTARIPCVLSGGTEGVLSPHYLVLSRRADAAAPGGAPALAIGTAFSPMVAPADIGRRAHVLAIADAVRAAITDAGITDDADVHFVQVKTPFLTVPRLAALAEAGIVPSSPTPQSSMALARAAGAFGVAIALGELDRDAPVETMMLKDFSVHCDRASISSGVEVVANEVVVLGNSPGWTGPLRITHRPMADALDARAITRALADLDLGDDATRAQRLCGVLVKAEPDRRGTIRGHRHTMLGDTDIDAQRHIRGALGGLVAGLVGDTRIFVSGGAEHQGPDGGGLLAIIAETGSD
ncbi:ring-opening amidohydrolase [Acuticoccus kandeliae]|uniref:cyanuric acid amidohydrolase n=1 Tax=Acuticoccus kandeliae TaxID=2073160 RepID=UPI00196AD182|nr:ring-opening amidohydrolase [Acuticoccus kandeliae]